MFLDNFVYAISYGGVIAKDATNLSGVGAKLALPSPQVNDGYGLRVAGMAMAASLLSGFWVLGTATLLVQDREAGATRIFRDWRTLRRKQRKAFPHRKPVFSEGIRRYLAREFHPSDAQIDHLASEYLASVGLA